MYLLLVLTYLFITLVISPLIPFSIINNISISVTNSNFISVIFKQACHTNPGADKKCARLSLYSLRHIFLKLSNTSGVIMYHFGHIGYDNEQYFYY